MDIENIFLFFENTKDIDNSHKYIYESIGNSISYDKFIKLTESLIKEVTELNIVNTIHLFHDYTLRTKIDNIISSIGIDTLLELYLLYDYLLMDIKYFNMISKILISYFNFNEDKYNSCNEKIKFLLNNVYKNEVVSDLLFYTNRSYTYNSKKKSKYDKLDEAIKNRHLTEYELKCIKEKLRDYEYSHDPCYFNDFDEDIHTCNEEKYVLNNEYNKVEYVIKKFCDETNFNNIYFLPNNDKEEADILFGFIIVQDYWEMMNKFKQEINVNDYNLCEINYENNNMANFLIVLNKFMCKENIFFENNKIRYTCLAGYCGNLNLVKEIVKYYNICDLYLDPFHIDEYCFTEEIKKYLLSINFYISEYEYYRMSSIKHMEIELKKKGLKHPSEIYDTPEKVNKFLFNR